MMGPIGAIRPVMYGRVWSRMIAYGRVLQLHLLNSRNSSRMDEYNNIA